MGLPILRRSSSHGEGRSENNLGETTYRLTTSNIRLAGFTAALHQRSQRDTSGWVVFKPRIRRRSFLSQRSHKTSHASGVRRTDIGRF
jgi:hypothetical protein